MTSLKDINMSQDIRITGLGMVVGLVAKILGSGVVSVIVVAAVTGAAAWLGQYIMRKITNYCEKQISGKNIHFFIVKIISPFKKTKP